MLDSSLPDELQQLLDGAYRVPSGFGRLAIYEEAVRFADTLNNTYAGNLTRHLLIGEAACCQRYDLYATNFSWCLSTARNHPESYSTSDLIAQYSDVIGKFVNFPDISRHQYDLLFEDVVREYRYCGYSLRTPYHSRRSVGVDFGDREMSAAADSEWRKHPRDAFSPDLQLELILQIAHDCFMGNDIAALRCADKYYALPNRNPRRDAWVARESLLPLLKLGRDEEAASKSLIAGKYGEDNPGYIWDRSLYLEYLARIADFKRGIAEFKTQFPKAMAHSDPLSRFYFFRPAALLFDGLVSVGTDTVAIKPPINTPWTNRTAQLSTHEVRDWLHSEASAIAKQFDCRNGNTYYSEWLAGTS